MYYEEQWIDGKLCYRHMPNGDWIEFDLNDYRQRLLEIMEQQVNSVDLADVGSNEVALRNAAQKIVDITNNRQPEKYYDAFIELQEALKQ